MIDLDEVELRERFGLVKINQMLGSDARDTFQLKDRYAEARAILQQTQSVQRIETAWFGGGSGRIIAIFLFRFTSGGQVTHRWVLCGDIPWFSTPYLEGDTSASALARYLEQARQWNANGGIDPAESRFSPFHTEWVDELSARFQFIEERILPKVSARIVSTPVP